MYKTLILTQEKGYLDLQTKEIKGNRSCYLIEEEHKKLGHDAKQLQINDCYIRDNTFYCCDAPFDLKPYQSVILRTWGDQTQHKKALEELLPFLVNQGIYSDNSIEAILSTAHKERMHAVIEETGSFCPRSLVIKNDHPIDEINSFIKILHSDFNKKSLSSNYPAYVSKPSSGTHGNGVTMFFLGEEQQLLEHIKSLQDPCILQEYIKPKFLLAEQPKEAACSAHYRIIMSRQSNQSLAMIGGLNLQRTGSWISNTHCPHGELYKKILHPEDVSKELFEALTMIANKIKLNQFGADVLVDDEGKFFILELNDGMGISGELLEKQRIPAQYVRSHVDRLTALLKPRVAAILSQQGLYATNKLPVQETSFIEAKDKFIL